MDDTIDGGQIEGLRKIGEYVSWGLNSPAFRELELTGIKQARRSIEPTRNTSAFLKAHYIGSSITTGRHKNSLAPFRLYFPIVMRTKHSLHVSDAHPAIENADSPTLCTAW
jgi:hypothetical protein